MQHSHSQRDEKGDGVKRFTNIPRISQFELLADYSELAKDYLQGFAWHLLESTKVRSAKCF